MSPCIPLTHTHVWSCEAHFSPQLCPEEGGEGTLEPVDVAVHIVGLRGRAHAIRPHTRRALFVSYAVTSGIHNGIPTERRIEEVTQGQPYVPVTEEPQCTWEQDKEHFIVRGAQSPQRDLETSPLTAWGNEQKLSFTFPTSGELSAAGCIHRLGNG